MNLPSYADLDINQKIELKGLLRAWADITVERLQKSLLTKVYGRSVKRSARRTNRLFSDWQVSEKGGIDNPGVLISSLYYGRFSDLGVGRGARKGSAKAEGRARRWYRNVVSRELSTIRSLLIQRYSLAIVQIAQQQIADQVSVSI